MSDTVPEKQGCVSAASAAPVSSKPPRRWATTLALAAIGLLAVGHFNLTIVTTPGTPTTPGDADVPARDPEATKDYLWSDISPSRDLEWHPCHGGKFDCARLDVPLDWLEPSEEKRMYLAVIRKKATTQKDYRGPVIVNPGGPGGSGVNLVLHSADDLQTIVGDNHDILSFDPRGVDSSVPRVDCWDSTQRRHDWKNAVIPVLDSHPGVVYDAYAVADAISHQCEAHINATSPGLLENLSTASHARDMLAITEAAGYPKLKYWGISYGSILGGTFAAMFPDRVERLLSDGNVDYTSWYQLDQSNFFVDTDDVMEAFFYFCHKAGPERCAFYKKESPAAIRQRFFALLAQLRAHPVLIEPHAYDPIQELPAEPQLVTYSRMQMLILTSLYKAYYKFPELAEVMAALEKGDGLPYYNMTGGDKSSDIAECARTPSPMDPQIYDSGDDSFRAITCADGTQFTDTPEEFAEYAARLQNISQYAGAAYTHFKLGCAGRTIRPRDRFPAPWIDKDGNRPNTSFPILFIGNVADNVTPLSSAYRNSEAFPGSEVLVQRSWGHASLAAPSTCTASIIRAYFQDGKLPAKGTKCEQDYEIFGGAPVDVAGGDEISRAIHSLSRNVDLGHGKMLA